MQSSNEFTFEDYPVVVELSPTPGDYEVSNSPSEMIEKSKQAINNAISSIIGMIKKMGETLSTLPNIEFPDEMELQFGLKLDTETNAIVVKSGSETQFSVTLKWKRSEINSAKTTKQQEDKK